MGFFDQVKDTITSTSQDVASKAKETSETIKIKNKIKTNKSEIKKQLEALGTAYYETNVEGYGSEYADFFEKIAELNREIKQYEEELDEVMGIHKCSECGNEVKEGSSFCDKCGAQII